MDLFKKVLISVMQEHKNDWRGIKYVTARMALKKVGTVTTTKIRKQLRYLKKKGIVIMKQNQTDKVLTTNYYLAKTK